MTGEKSGTGAIEHLGLFDTPLSRREGWLAATCVALTFVAFLAVLPIAGMHAPEIAAFVPTVSGVLFVGELIVATLLYAQGAFFRSRALMVLASGYVVTALLLIPYALSFPGAFAPNGLLGAGLNTTAWLMILRRALGPLTIAIYAGLRPAEAAQALSTDRPRPRIWLWAAGSALMTVGLTLLATVGHDLLPPIFTNRRDAIPLAMQIYNGSMVAVMAVGIALLLRRRHTVLDTWLTVALATVLVESLLNLWVPGRYTVGWYGLFVLMLLAHLFVLLAMIAESSRLYLRLALATAARSRDRDARIMSMDGVAAAMSHEIGQPLAAVVMSATSAMKSLSGERPDHERAITSLRTTVEAAQRAFAVAKSTRAMFGKTSNSLSEFDLNGLVRESALLLDREMAAQHVSLRLALDEALPPIVGNRTQIQQVLVNLMTNAIESLGERGRRARRIAIRSAQPDEETVRIEVSDSGGGIDPDTLARLFEPFFTTKALGTGLGLPLSRTIAEAHGGRLWASAGEGGGATFHLELRRMPDPRKVAEAIPQPQA